MATKAPQTPATPVDPGKELTKGWIQYLKNNKIVKMQSDPKSGKLSYNRPVTTDDVSKFLIDTGKFDETAVNSAIQKALAGKTTKTPTGTDMPTEPFTTPGAVVPDKDGKIPTAGSDQATKQDDSSKKLSQTPDAIRKRKQRAAATQQGKSGQAAFSQMAGQLVKEDFQDQPGTDVSESDVEKIFAALATPKPKRSQQSPKKPKVSPEEKTQKKYEELSKLKRMIRDTMTDGQRKALWRALNDI